MKTYKVTFRHPAFPYGKKFGLTGVGAIENGKSILVDEDAARRFKAMFGKTLDEFFEGHGHVQVEIQEGVI